MQYTGKPLFYDAKLKIERANKHIHELADLINTFTHPDRYRLLAEPHTDLGMTVMKFQMNNEGLNEIPLIAGDAIHNLRTALDHLVCELVTRAGKSVTRRTGFKFWKSRKKAVAGIERVIQGVSVEVITSFLDWVQPYSGGNRALLMLHALDIADKHRLLVPIFTAAGVTFIHMREGQKIGTIALGVRGKETPKMIEVHPGAKLEGYEHPVLHVCFDEIEGCEALKGHSVVPILHQLRQSVSVVVWEIEEAVLASRPWFSL